MREWDFSGALGKSKPLDNDYEYHPFQVKCVQN